ncbi:zinc transporter ZIP1-like [Uloborus diversus]|uniref:zinc transporter ZIP1-like n=1 Tax=Uloborus diversus TaxID=327109 RepID=UPI00240A10F0|nr:zinc transporter ZIP1-like [Uloborus diversus]
MELSYVKLGSAVFMTIVTFAFTMLPLFLIRLIRNTSGDIRVVSFLSCFGGGVFLATCLLDLFPGVQEQMNLVFKETKSESNFPVSEFLLAFGFLTVLITEQIVLTFQDKRDKNITDEKVPILNDVDNLHEPAQNNVANYGSITADPELHDHEISFHQDLSSHSILRSVLLVFALSLHSIFEGLAIGLQTSTQNVVRILVAVLIHKCIIAFTLGLNLVNSKLRKCDIVKGNIFFSLTSPIGIIVGFLVVDFIKGVAMLIASGVLQGLAAGTFLYVTFFEILPHELNSGRDRMLKMLCLVLGFSVVTLLLTFLPD